MTGAASTLGGAAARYASRGLFVHPLRPGTKLPLLTAWQERATTHQAVIAGLWSRWPDAGVAIATGAGSGVIVLDVDPRHGGDDSLAALERQHGEMPTTWRCLTAGGGLHAYFHHPGGLVSNRVGIWPGIDVRGDGGYVVAPPTELEGGRGYAWEVGYAPHEAPLGSAPAWLLKPVAGRCAPEARAPEWWRGLVRDGVDPGARNDAITRLAGHLLRRGVDPYVTLELVTGWNALRCRPPLAPDEVVRTVDSIARREVVRRRNAA